MQLNPAEISELLKAKIENLDTKQEIHTRGTVISVTDGIVRVHGLSDVMQGEMLEFPNNTFGLAIVANSAISYSSCFRLASKSACLAALTSLRKMASAPFTAKAATCSRNASRARLVSCSTSDFA